MPSGTINDNTLSLRFIFACERYFGRKLSYLGLGCAGWGLVRNFLQYGHFSVGIEGNDLSYRMKRAEWARIPMNLFTADIIKPFELKDSDGSVETFDVIGAWEVMEHLPEESLPSFLLSKYCFTSLLRRNICCVSRYVFFATSRMFA
jgi:2-polyprenyl-3-methyl-5-hydroxy-6-metoxy-1,4-benzoquinol methylase